MKRIVPGIGLGAAVVAVAVWILHEEQPAVRSAPVAGSTSIDSTTGMASTVAPARHTPEMDDSSDSERATEQVAALPAAGHADEPESVDWDAPCACAAAHHARRNEQEEAARRAEPKDINWAYEMEQLLGQFIADHPKAEAIHVSHIECRTSFCEIHAAGPPDSATAFGEVVGEAANEPWSTLSAKRTGWSSGDSSRQEFGVIYSRMPISTTTGAANTLPAWMRIEDEEACECASFEWLIRKARHREAARAAEPKDVYWAYATEQKLQQSIAAHPQAVSFQISSIDCRTTFCEIKGIGVTDQSPESFSEILGDAQRQNRLGLGGDMSLSTSQTDGGTSLTARIYRKQ